MGHYTYAHCGTGMTWSGQNDLLIAAAKPMFRFSTVALRLVPDVVVAQLVAADERLGNR